MIVIFKLEEEWFLVELIRVDICLFFVLALINETIVRKLNTKVMMNGIKQ